MKRPLMWFCICLVVAAALRLEAFQTPMQYSADGFSPKDGEKVTITGRVYWKDTKYFYLDSIEFIHSETSNISLQSNISLHYGFMGESKKFMAEELLLGSRVCLQGTFCAFSAATNPGEFDAAEYYRILKLGGKLTDAELLAQGGGHSWLKETLYRQKISFRERLYHVFPKKEASVMGAILLGEKEGLSPEIKELYQRNGIAHILSISGLHISMIGLGIYRGLRRIGASPRIAAISGGGILLLYGIMTGFSVSSCRAIGMYLIRMAAEMAGRTYDMMTAAAVMAAAMALPNPLYLHHSGFWLSFGSIWGIGMLSPLLGGRKGRQKDKKRPDAYRQNARPKYCKWLQGGRRFLESGWERLKRSMAGGLSIVLATLPIQLWFYFEIPTYSVIVNLFVIPFMSLLMLTGIVILLVPGSGVIGTVDCLILWGYDKLCGFSERLPLSLWNPGRPQWWQMALYYMLLLGAAGILRAGMGGSEGKEPQNGKFRKMLYMCKGKAILTILVIAMPAVIFAHLPGKDAVTFLDVGQGDCVCLRTQGGKTYLFDCGSSSRSQVGKYVLKPFLKYYGIRHIDGIFLSHPDFDHYSGIEELLLCREEWGIQVEELMLSPASGGGGEGHRQDGQEGGAEKTGFEKVMEAALFGREPVPWTYLYAGDGLQADGIRIDCLHPSENGCGEDGNQASQCFLVELGKSALLLTGDVEKEGEKSLLLQMQERGIGAVTVLKAAHHGSANSTSEEFLAQASPALTIISCGRKNRYGHPHKELLERVERSGSRILQTAEQGAITLQFDKEGVRGYCYVK